MQKIALVCAVIDGHICMSENDLEEVFPSFQTTSTLCFLEVNKSTE